MELIRYSDADIDVRLGDHVTYMPMYFWRAWKPGRVTYVPGQSPVIHAMENNGNQWIGVDGQNGTYRRGLIDPLTFRVQPTIRFQRRAAEETAPWPST